MAEAVLATQSRTSKLGGMPIGVTASMTPRRRAAHAHGDRDRFLRLRVELGEAFVRDRAFVREEHALAFARVIDLSREIAELVERVLLLVALDAKIARVLHRREHDDRDERARRNPHEHARAVSARRTCRAASSASSSSS